MYVAVKGGEKAIAAAHELLAAKRRGNPELSELGPDQIREQLSLAVHRVMAEGSLYAEDLAALAVKQARGDLVEAVFLLRAYRTTLPRLGSGQPLDTGAMRVRRRVSATYKDIPGGQVLGPTFDYTHRLLDASLADVARAKRAAAEPETGTAPQACRADSPAGRWEEAAQAFFPEPDPHARGHVAVQRNAPGARPAPAAGQADREGTPDNAPNNAGPAGHCPKVLRFLENEGLLPPEVDPGASPGDLTRQPLCLPADRDVRLQNLARADEGFLLALAYSTQRGFGSTHPFAGEIRMGEVEVEIVPEELGFPVTIGEITLTECETVNKFSGNGESPPCFTRGYGLAFGESERKALSMALVDRALRSREYDEPQKGPAQDEEFVLFHSDNVEASGFVQHLKLPHYVDFQAELELVRSLRRQHAAPRAENGHDRDGEAHVAGREEADHAAS